LNEPFSRRSLSRTTLVLFTCLYPSVHKGRVALRVHADQHKNRTDVCRRRLSSTTSSEFQYISGQSRKWSTGTKNCLPGSALIERSSICACMRVRARAHERFRSVRSEKPSTDHCDTTTARTEASRYFLLCPYMRQRSTFFLSSSA